MQVSREDVLARERRWALPVALATLVAFALLVSSVIAVGPVNGDGEAEVLRAAHEHSSDITLSSILQASAFALLLAPLIYLFQAASARNDRMRRQLIGIVIAAPVLLAAGSIFLGMATKEAATDFLEGKAKSDLTIKEATQDCRSERKDDADAFREDFGAAATALPDCATTKVADEEAENAVTEASSRSAATSFGLGGRLAMAFALFYSCLHGMRTGLLTRFWGSLGMALAAAALLLVIQFTFIWFIYFALLVAGWVPGGRPPAWAAGEAIPWPSPGEKTSEELRSGADDEPIEAEGAEIPPSNGEPRKRKRRD